MWGGSVCEEDECVYVYACVCGGYVRVCGYVPLASLLPLP